MLYTLPFTIQFTDVMFPAAGEVAACTGVASYVTPRAARNTDNQWRYIVNPGPGSDGGGLDGGEYRQRVRVEVCAGADRPCNLPSPAATVCRQKYARHRLVAHNCREKTFCF